MSHLTTNILYFTFNFQVKILHSRSGKTLTTIENVSKTIQNSKIHALVVKANFLHFTGECNVLYMFKNIFDFSYSILYIFLKVFRLK